MTQDDPLPRTLGERLDAHGRRLTARLHPTLPWAGALGVFMGHAAGLVVGADRFERIECDADGPALYFATAVRGRSRRAGRARDGGPPAPGPPGRPEAEDRAARGLAAAPPPAGRALPAPVRARLRSVVGSAADVLRVHDDDRSDAISQERQADAVTVGRDVHFRRGRLRPSEPSGFGLLVHEATHVLGFVRPGASWQRASGAGMRAEEAEALANERAVTLPRRPGPAGPPVAPLTADRTAGGPAPAFAEAAGSAPATVSAPTAHPQRAPADRPIDGPVGTPPHLDVQALRRQVIDDVMRQLRSEFERGG